MKNKFLVLALLLIALVSCKKDEAPTLTPVILQTENLITSFQLNIAGQLVNGEIDQQNHLITLETEDADLNSITPTINFSDKASIKPAVNIAQNFNSEVTYTIYAENGDPNVYRVLVNNSSSEKQILGFQLLVNAKIYEGEVDNEAATVYIETDQRVDSADDVISVSEGATITPIKEDPQNFYEPVEYLLTAENGTTRTFTLTVKAFEFYSNGPNLFYSNARAIASGAGIDTTIPNSSVVLENEENSYVLSTENPNSSTHTNGMLFASFSYSFPQNIVSADDYKLKFLISGDVKTETSFNIDVLAENVPNPTSLNQDLYVWNDVLVLTGENLTDTISIPSNGSIFIIKNSSSYDLAVNNQKTELTLTLDYHYLFPSYFARPQEEKTITLYGPGLRLGPTIQTIFK